jgi:hypothetical protein
VDELILKYDGEPFEPAYIVSHVQTLLEGGSHSLELSLEEAREMAYHYIRSQLGDKGRPGRIDRQPDNGYGEPTWSVEIVSRIDGTKQGDLTIGVDTGSTHAWESQI